MLTFPGGAVAYQGLISDEYKFKQFFSIIAWQLSDNYNYDSNLIILTKHTLIGPTIEIFSLIFLI